MWHGGVGIGVGVLVELSVLLVCITLDIISCLRKVIHDEIPQSSVIFGHEGFEPMG